MDDAAWRKQVKFVRILETGYYSSLFRKTDRLRLWRVDFIGVQDRNSGNKSLRAWITVAGLMLGYFSHFGVIPTYHLLGAWLE